MILAMVAFCSPALAQGDIGGDDVLVNFAFGRDDRFDGHRLERGHLHCEQLSQRDTFNLGFRVFRSQDGGTTWDLWGSLNPLPGGPKSTGSPASELPRESSTGAI